MKLIAAAEVVAHRRTLCSACPKKVQHHALPISICDLCKCPIFSKTLKRDSVCPHSFPKW